METLMQGPVGPSVTLNGHVVDYFCGTSYYGLHADLRVIQAACSALRQFGTGPGNTVATPPSRELMTQISSFFGTEDARVVASGYLADMMLLQTLSARYDVAFVDERSHYSVVDGVRAIGTPVIGFAHLDPGDLRAKLRAELKARETPLVISDGVFPVTGDIAPVSELMEIMAEYDHGLLCIDDSHGVGVLGDHGRGTLEHECVDHPNAYFAATLSKAFGGLGGFVTGTKAFAADVTRSNRIPEGASPLSIGATAAAVAGLKILATHPEMRAALRSNVSHLRRKLADIGFDAGDSPVPIICLRGRAGLDLERMATALRSEGLVVSHIAPRGYSDAPGVEVLRIAVFSGHTTEQLDRLAGAIARFA